jgi:L-alanine-DL-glutamate epimerase-like enolase superfamily enzyme
VRIVAVYERAVPMRASMRNAVIAFDEMTTSVLAVETDVVRDGARVIGYGFNSNGRYAQSGLLRERFARRLVQAAPGDLLDHDRGNFDPERVWQIVMANEKPGGHGDRSVAVGVIDMAIWDAVAKIAGQPLHRVLAERYGDGDSDETVEVYAAGGYYSDAGAAALQDELRSYLDLGYTTVKMKIGGAPLAEDLARVEAALSVVGEGGCLAVDANGALDLRRATEYAAALAPYNLRWFEEAGDPLDYQLQAQIADAYEAPLATGENLFSRQDVRNLLRHGGLRNDRDILQMDPVLGYGVVEYARMLECMSEHHWSPRRAIPHGGHQLALNAAAGLRLGGNESYPGVFQPFGGFADAVAVEHGRVRVLDAPGIGFEEKRELYAVLRSIVRPAGRLTAATGRRRPPGS